MATQSAIEICARTESGADWALRDRVKVFVDRKIAQLEIAQKSHDEGKNAPNIPSILSQNEASDARIADKGVKDEKIGPDPFGMGEDSWVGVQERKRLEAGALGAMGMSGFGKLPAELRVMIFECLGLTFAAAGDHSYGSSTGR
ncbi:hypothetical protein MMC21_008246 [Puttea exsequens]|nr:hypothetical protein [Puttea exsequens]